MVKYSTRVSSSPEGDIYIMPCGLEVHPLEALLEHYGDVVVCGLYDTHWAIMSRKGTQYSAQSRPAVSASKSRKEGGKRIDLFLPYSSIQQELMTNQHSTSIWERELSIRWKANVPQLERALSNAGKATETPYLQIPSGHHPSNARAVVAM